MLKSRRRLTLEGYFAETDRQTEQVPSPFAGKSPVQCSIAQTDTISIVSFMVDGALRSIATTIYYLLAPDEPNGVFHMNKSAVRFLPGLGIPAKLIILEHIL